MPDRTGCLGGVLKIGWNRGTAARRCRRRLRGAGVNRNRAGYRNGRTTKITSKSAQGGASVGRGLVRTDSERQSPVSGSAQRGSAGQGCELQRSQCNEWPVQIPGVPSRCCAGHLGSCPPDVVSLWCERGIGRNGRQREAPHLAGSSWLRFQLT